MKSACLIYDSLIHKPGVMSNIIGVCGGSCINGPNAVAITQKAEQIGREIAKAGCILLCGGKGGVMEAVCRGASQEQGLTVGLLPYSKNEANGCVKVPLPTGMGYKRNSLIIESADCIIAVSGNWGTLNEITFALVLGKPVVFLKGSDGFVDLFIQSDFINQIQSDYFVTDDPKEAVEKAVFYSQNQHTKD